MLTATITEELQNDNKWDNVLAALPDDEDEGGDSFDEDFDLEEDELGIDDEDLDNFDDFSDEEFEEDFEDADFDEFDEEEEAEDLSDDDF